MEQFSGSVSHEKDHNYNAFNSEEFQAILDRLENQDTAEERITGKKSRLSCDQVKVLEKMFAVDDKIEQEQKAKIATELGLHPRQIAVWFQNRRARCKTKRLERDYNLLKADYDGLKFSYDELQQQNQALAAELRELKVKLEEGYIKQRHSIEAEAMFLKPKDVASDEAELSNPNHGLSNNASFLDIKGLVGSKEGLSDSDSSGVFNDDSNLNAKLLMSPASSSLGYECSSLYSSWMNCFQFPDPRPIATREYEQQLVETEEQSLFSAKHESCNVFLSDQANTSH